MGKVLDLATELKAKEQEEIDAAVAKQSKIDEMVAASDAEVAASYEEGLAKGGVVNGDGKIFSNEEMNAEILPREEKIAALQSQLDAVPASIEQAKADAVAAKLAELKAQYEAQQVAEASGETGFGALLG
jgi:uncharacterized protein YaiI (UPF0178 family)